MTGSGKTGLAVALIEEAALDGIPVIAIDPKGDLGNLLLTFPDLAPGDFRPWIEEAAAAREGIDADEQAARVAKRWRDGLAAWDQAPERIARFASAAERVLYTPGSQAGRPLAALRSFAPPAAALAGDPDALRDRIAASASSLLGLLGIEADPLRSREHILLSTLLERAWREGRELDVPALIHEVQKPPVERVGVMDLESFFPAKERFAFALGLNNLAASPSFAAWSEGEPLEAARLLHAPDGRPRISVVSIAHLSDAERMFVVTLLLSELVAWMRAQPGSSSLRAILYMDEVFGYLPPVANPPSKAPMLTLLKQARAFGLGVVVATQNPVDLDYKALSNAGTWFLGRLQTERDKARVLDGLEGASSAAGARFDRSRIDTTLSALRSRVFLMSNAHEDEPVLFESRQVLSYLAGPLTREQIRRLAASPREATPAAERGAARVAAAPAAAPAQAADAKPVVPAGVAEAYLPASGAAPPLYRPTLLGVASLHYVQSRAGLDAWETAAWLAPLSAEGAAAPWEHGRELGRAAPAFGDGPEPGARYAPLPPGAGRAESFERWRRMLATHLYRARPLRLWRCAAPAAVSRPGESEGEFRARLCDAARARRDQDVEKLRARYAPQLARLRERIAQSEERVAREQAEYGQRKVQAAISIGATVVGALFGRKLGSVGNVGRATTAARGVGRAADERGDVARASERVEEVRAKLAQLERALADDLARIESPADPKALALEELLVPPRKADLEVKPLVLVWSPEPTSS
jgi:hypothetical protein